jgi:putative ABC transport system permease protein
MLQNYLKIAWRNLKQNKSYTLINFIGLTLGMTCCILIALYVKSELNYDQFNKNIDRIAVIGSNFNSQKFGLTPYPLADALSKEAPEVQKTTSILKAGYPHLALSRDKKNYVTIGGEYAQPSFFDFFSFKLLKGNKNLALSAPNSIIITKKTAKKLFGDKQAKGKTIYWRKNGYYQNTIKALTITGIIADPPKNSSIQFGALISMKTRGQNKPNWHTFSANTFALLSSKVSNSTLHRTLQLIKNKHISKENKLSFFTTPFKSYHLSALSQKKGFSGKSVYLYLFGSIALFILLLACINYVNLSTARAITRVREVGVRKTLGANRLQLMGQFIGESVLISVCSFLVAVYLAYLLTGPFNYLFKSSVVFTSYVPLLGWLLLAAALIGVLAGSYPALYLSGTTPASIISNGQRESRNNGRLRKALVIVQFAIASVFIISSVVIYRQLYFAQHTNLGFNGNQVVVFPLPKSQMWKNRSTIRQVIAGLSGVQKASMASGVPGSFSGVLGSGYETKKLSPQAIAPLKKKIPIQWSIVDYNYLSTLGIKLLAGRNFSHTHPSDQESAYILNKKAVVALGWTPKEAIGKAFKMMGEEGTIVGVTQNFHITSMHKPISPVVLRLENWTHIQSGFNLLAKLSPTHIAQTVNIIEKNLKTFAPNATFSYKFLDQQFEAMYRNDRRTGHVIGLFAFIGIFVACMGLFGLSTFAVTRRVKEIGIRKVLGASESSIVKLLSKDFLKLVAIGFVIAVPIGWYGMHRCLQNFAYKINMSW